MARTATPLVKHHGNRSLRRGAVAWLGLALGVAAGCGTGPLQMRQGSVEACESAVRKGDGALLGWVSIAAMDRWVGAIDRLGTRSQLLAPGSSVRDRIRGGLNESAQKAGAIDADWLVWTRPIHVLVQYVAGEDPRGGATVLLPIRDRALFELKNAKLMRPPAAGAELAIQPIDVPVPGQVAFPHPTTALGDVTAPQLGRAASLARCAQTLQPASLVQAGVSISAVARHYRAQLDRELAALKPTGGQPGMAASEFGLLSASLGPWLQWLDMLLAGSKTLEVGLSDDRDDLVVDARVTLAANSELAGIVERIRAAGPSPLLRRLPESTWLLSASTSDPTSSERQIDAALETWRALLPNDTAALAALEGMMRGALRRAGPFSAVALHMDGPFPLAMTGPAQSSDPAGLIDVVADGSLQALRALLLARTEIGQQLPEEVRRALNAGSWQALLTAAQQQLDAMSVALSHQTVAADGLRCQILRAKLPPHLQGGAGNPVMSMASRMVGDHLEVGVCADTHAVILVFGRDAMPLAQAARARAGAADDPKQGVIAAPWYRQAFGDAVHTTQFGFYPAPLIQIARGLMPMVPEWPQEASMRVGCLASAGAMSCRLGIPAVAIATIVRAVKGGFGGD